MEKRYQVFVSSTYMDLIEERQEVMRALLELDCIPSGMELFPAANEDQWSNIKKVIDDCDYYILIVGGRYGSLGPTGLSYTEQEYRYAIDKGKPTISFLHKSPGSIVSSKTESTDEGRKKLEAFRCLVQQKLCKHWENAEGLGSVVSRSLIQLIKNVPAVGWVRASELPNRDATAELLRLRNRVEELESQLSRARTAPPKGAEDLAGGSDEHEFKYSFRTRGETDLESVVCAGSFRLSWNEVFNVVAPLMVDEASESAILTVLDDAVRVRTAEARRSDPDLADEEQFAFHFDRDDFQTVKVQLRALGLIEMSERARSLKDAKTYWTLTAYGNAVLIRLRAIRRGAVEGSRAAPPSLVTASSV